MDIFSRALASLGGGYVQGQDEARQINDKAAAVARQKSLDAQAQANSDRQFGLQSQASQLQRAMDLMKLGETGATSQAPQAPTPPIQTGMMGGPPSAPLPSAQDATPPSVDLGDVGGGQHMYLPQGTSAPAKRQQAMQGLKDAAKHYGVTDYTDAQAALDADHPTEAVAQMKLWAESKKPVKGQFKPYQRPDGTYGSMDEATGLDMQTGKPAQGMVPKDPNASAPKGSYQQDKNGNFIWLPAGGGTPINYGVQGAPKGGGGGGQSLSPEDRAKMLAQAKLDNDTMKRIEKRVLDGDLKFGTGAGLATAAAGAHGTPLAEGISVLGNAAAGALDPDIQQYITANQSYGRIMGNLQSKRYTDNQAQIEKNISGLKGNDLENTIRYKQQLRDSSLADPTIHEAPSGAGGRAAGSGGKKPSFEEWQASQRKP